MSKTPATPVNALATSSRRIANVPRSSTFRSIVNFVSSPFHRRNEQKDLEREDSRSRSGSVDNWDGQPPADIFTMAGAMRTAEAEAADGDVTMEDEVHVHFDNQTRYTHAPPPPAPPRAAESSSTSSARTMLARFLQVKAGAPMTQEDMRSFELLTQRVADEDARPMPAPFVFGSRGERAESTAFSFSSTNLMPSRALARSQTTNNLSLSTSTSNSFKPSARRPTYLGPGMSSRRKPIPTSTRPFTTPILPGDKRKAEDESAVPEKKRRTEIDIEEADRGGMTASKSMPDFGHLRALGQFVTEKEAGIMLQQSRLRESFAAPTSPALAPRSETEIESAVASPGPETSPTSASASAAAKKRTADIMLDIIDASKPTVPEPPKKEVVNPYQGYTLPSSSLHRSVLRASTRKPATPKRKLASSVASSSTPLGKTPTPLERIESASRAEAQPSPSKRIRSLARTHAETPSKTVSPDPFEEPEQTPVPAPSTRTKTPEPVIKSTSAPSVSVAEPSKVHSFSLNATASSSTKSIEAIQSLGKVVPVKRPSFTSPAPIRERSPSPEHAVESAPIFKATASPIKQSARDIALAVPRLALPFVTFVVSFPAPSPSQARAAALQAAKIDLLPFTWSTAAKGKGKAAAVAESQPQWKCQVCSLLSPNSATQCVVCEADRPVDAPAAQPKAFNWAAAGMPPPPKSATGNQITCGDCTLQIPKDTTKCPYCEAVQPGSKSAAPAALPPTPAAPAAAFNWGAAGMKQVKSAGWSCSTCMVNNSADATKCVSCEMPK